MFARPFQSEVIWNDVKAILQFVGVLFFDLTIMFANFLQIETYGVIILPILIIYLISCRNPIPKLSKLKKPFSLNWPNEPIHSVTQNVHVMSPLCNFIKRLIIFIYKKISYIKVMKGHWSQNLQFLLRNSLKSPWGKIIKFGSLQTILLCIV